jgi:ATP-dependent RNA helicase SUPV3L1/SUV3
LERLQEFPESPPPGLVTIPNIAEVPKQHYTLSGYHPAGHGRSESTCWNVWPTLLRAKDSRVGFEATPDMLSITGMTLEQFADLMTGLGYKGEKAERVKVKVAEPVVVPDAPVSTAPIPKGNRCWPPGPSKSRWPKPTRRAEAAPVEMELSTPSAGPPSPASSAPNARNGPIAPNARKGIVRRATVPNAAAGGERPQGDRPKGDRPQGDRPKGDRPQGERRDGGFKDGNKGKGGKPDRRDGGKPGGAKAFEARPPRVEKPIDPDNPFAVLAALKTKS